METGRILIVENDKITAWDLQQLLEGFGYNVIANVAEAEQALEVLDQLQPDLFLLDIYLPGSLDGVALAEIIQRDHGIPFIYLTAYTDTETMTRATATHPHTILVKPIQSEELLTAIREAIQN